MTCEQGERAECGGEWVTGRWTVCSQGCGEGRQSRRVECVLEGEGGDRLGGEGECGGRRPRGERQCKLQECGATWYTSQWAEVGTALGSTASLY